MQVTPKLDVPEASDSPGLVPPPTAEVTELLVRLIAGWRPSKFTSSPNTSLSWNNGEHSWTMVAAYEDGGKLVVDVDPCSVPLERFISGDLRNRPCRGDLPGNTKFLSQLAHVRRIGTTARLECSYWQVWSDDDVPHLWVAPVAVRTSGWLDFANIAFDIKLVDSTGNSPRRTIATVLRLKSHYEYYLLLPNEESDTAFLMVDTLSASLPKREILHGEFLTLQFVLGQRLRLGAFAGVNSAGQTMAHAGGPYGTFIGEGSVATSIPKCPIAADSADPRVARAAARYSAALFASLATAERECPEVGVRAAMTLYLTSIGDYLEGATLKLHVALEGLASKLFDTVAEGKAGARSSTPKGLYLTSKHAEWKAWCKANAARIRELSRPEVKDAVLEAVRRADRPGASQIVPTMLEHYSIPLTPEINDVLAARHELVHEARLPEENNVDTLILNESVPRTLLVALLAKAVDYGGPIRGYGSSAPAWWSASEPPPGDEVLRRVVEVELQEEEWNSFARGPRV